MRIEKSNECVEFSNLHIGECFKFESNLSQDLYIKITRSKSIDGEKHINAVNLSDGKTIQVRESDIVVKIDAKVVY